MNEFINSLNLLDWIIAIIILVFVIWGIFKGLIRGIISFVGVIVGFIVASRFYEQTAGLFVQFIQNESIRNLLGFACVLILFMIALGVAGYFLRVVLKKVKLGWVDHLLGGLLGLVKGLALTCIIILVLVAFLPPGSKAITGSQLTPAVITLSKAVTALVPGQLKAQFDTKLEDLKAIWGQRALGAVIQNAVPEEMPVLLDSDVSTADKKAPQSP